MPRYYFHTNREPARDNEGIELENLSVAKCEAVKMAGTLICESAGTFWDSDDFEMSVTNDNGLTLFSLMFVGTEATAIGTPRPRPHGRR